MRAVSLFVLVWLVAGCASPTASKPVDPQSVAEGTQAPSTSTADAGGGGIQPMTTAPIPNAPVSGSESLQGGGSNVGTVAKDRAKQAASQASTPNVGTESEGE